MKRNYIKKKIANVNVDENSSILFWILNFLTFNTLLQVPHRKVRENVYFIKLNHPRTLRDDFAKNDMAQVEEILSLELKLIVRLSNSYFLNRCERLHLAWIVESEGSFKVRKVTLTF